MSAGKKILTVFIILLIICVLGFLLYYFVLKDRLPENGGSSSARFYATYEDKKITADSSLSLDRTKEHVFKVKGNSEYSVKILPNKSANWNYLKDGVEFVFSDIPDLTSAFNIVKDKDTFKVTFPADFSTYKILQTLYPEAEILLPGDFNYLGEHFTLEITAEGETPIKTNFRVFNTTVNGVILDNVDIKILG